MKFIEPPGGRPWALLGLCGSSLLLNLVLLVKINSLPVSADAVEVVTATASIRQAEVSTPAPSPAVNDNLGVGEVAPQAPALVRAAPLPPGVERVEASVEHSLARTFRGALPADRADIAAAV